MKLYFILNLILITCTTASDNLNSVLCTDDFCDNYPTQGTSCPTLPKVCNKTDPNSGIFLPSPTPCNCCDYCIGYLKEGDSCSTGQDTTDTPAEICGPGLFCDANTLKCVSMQDTTCLQDQMAFDRNKQEGRTGDFQIRPICDKNGDYAPYHCIPGGVCYCVDKNGKRIFGTIDNTGKAEFDLPCTCSRNALEMSLILGRDVNPGEYFRCAKNGAYEIIQCVDDKSCICVDETDGTPTFEDVAPVEIWALSNNSLPCYDIQINNHGKFQRRCEEYFINKTRELEEKKKDYDVVLSYELPSCTLDGRFAPVQENHKYKFCSTPEGFPLKEYTLEKNSQNRDLLDTMNCKCAMALSIISSVEKPSCLSNGNYNSNQCRRGTCFTVDEDGNQII